MTLVHKAKPISNLSKPVRLRLGGGSTQGIIISAEAGFRYVKVLYNEDSGVLGRIYLYDKDLTEGTTVTANIIESITNISVGTTIDLSQYTYKSFYLEAMYGKIVGYELS